MLHPICAGQGHILLHPVETSALCARVVTISEGRRGVKSAYGRARPGEFSLNGSK